MANQPLQTVENNFTKGFVTEFTGLNFPENAATEVNNVDFSLVGDVSRRLGFDYENNFVLNSITFAGKAVTTYKWNNVAGTGSIQLIVTQVGDTLYFWTSSNATIVAPLSTTKLASTVTLSSFTATGGSFDVTKECQYADGNGYLFVFHPNCDPIYCNYSAGTITGNVIAIKTRDFIGCIDPLAVNTRPPTAAITATHNYNILNQGWVSANAWAALSSVTNVTGIGSKAFTVAAGLVINPGDTCTSAFSGGVGYTSWSGTVTAYAGTTLTINITSFTGISQFAQWGITSTNNGVLNTWVGSQGNYPSNADVWWRFKNTSGVFDPTTQANITIASGPAPKGHFVLYEFNQDRQAVSSVGGSLDKITTTARSTNGTWFQGRIWYAGVDASQQAVGVAPFYSWSEKIYFSQICLSGATNFGDCYQLNDPTAEDLFDILPTDGGVIQIQGSGPIYQLFPTQNGIIVRAANGVWFITGSRGIGFAANDYTITKISSIESISTNSGVDVQGNLFFWNEEGIYTVQPQQGGALGVLPITYDTIWTFYQEIPLSSKKYAKGIFDPLNYTIQWIYRSTDAADTTEIFTYDKVLSYNTVNKAFGVYTIDVTSAHVAGINYVVGPGGSTSPSPTIKYFTLSGVSSATFSEAIDTTYVDWVSTGIPVDYESYFITGYKLHGKGVTRFQMPYIYMYLRNDNGPFGYKIQGQWDYATDRDSNRWSANQIVEMYKPHFGMVFKRHRIRGQGLVLQIKVTSVSGLPFDVMGWTTSETKNAGL